MEPSRGLPEWLRPAVVLGATGWAAAAVLTSLAIAGEGRGPMSFATGTVALAGLVAGAWALRRCNASIANGGGDGGAALRLQALLNDSPDVFLALGDGGQFLYRSPSADRLLGPDAVAGDLVALASPERRAVLAEHLARPGARRRAERFELRISEGRAGWFDVRVSDLADAPHLEGRVVILRDLTDEVALRDDLERQARTDALTGLPNRRALDRLLADLAEGADVGVRSSVAFLALDLDGFKQINDTLGHHAGDMVLTHVANRLRRTVGADESVIRLGGDEFAVLLPSVVDVGQAIRRAESILTILDEPFSLGAHTERLRTSIGLAVTDDSSRIESLVVEADMAMSRAKRNGGDGVVVFDPDAEQHALATSRIARALRTADHDEEFRLVFQPIVTTADTEVVGYEALLRWTSPTLGEVPPDEFIPVAEVAGEICRIGRWVLDHVCRQVAVWEEAGLAPGVTVSFNASARELAEEGFVSGVLDAACRWGVSVERLLVEVTETSVLDDTGLARQRLEELRNEGVRVAIDDFGSGYSNLGQLLEVPFDVIKIDRSLLLTLSEMRFQAGGDPSDPCAIMEAIVAIAGVLGAKVLCEGVETEVQRRSLELSGISRIQGYLIGRPVPAGDLEIPLVASSGLDSTVDPA